MDLITETNEWALDQMISNWKERRLGVRLTETGPWFSNMACADDFSIMAGTDRTVQTMLQDFSERRGTRGIAVGEANLQWFLHCQNLSGHALISNETGGWTLRCSGGSEQGGGPCLLNRRSICAEEFSVFALLRFAM